MFQPKECLGEWLSGTVMGRGDCVHRHVDLLKITVHHLQKPFLDDGWGVAEVGEVSAHGKVDLLKFKVSQPEI